MPIHKSHENSHISYKKFVNFCAEFHQYDGHLKMELNSLEKRTDTHTHIETEFMEKRPNLSVSQTIDTQNIFIRFR